MRQRESYLAFQGCSPPETNTFGAVVRFEARPLRAMSAPGRTLNDRATIANTHTPPDASRHPPSPLARRAVAHGRAVLYIILVRHETKTEAARHPAPPDSAVPVMTTSLRATGRGLESLMHDLEQPRASRGPATARPPCGRDNSRWRGTSVVVVRRYNIQPFLHCARARGAPPHRSGAPRD